MLSLYRFDTIVDRMKQKHYETKTSNISLGVRKFDKLQPYFNESYEKLKYVHRN